MSTATGNHDELTEAVMCPNEHIWDATGWWDSSGFTPVDDSDNDCPECGQPMETAGV